MKFLAVAYGVAFAVTGAMAQLTSPTQNYNVSRPVVNGLYVAGQMLPCTVDIFASGTSDLALSVALTSTTNSSISYEITNKLDASKTGDTMSNNNVTFYQHSVNYNIPNNMTSGTYQVVFTDANTNTKVSVPVKILPMASASVVQSMASASSASAAATGTPSSQGSIFKDKSAALAMTPSQAMLSLVVIAVLATIA
ncbi:hypothetical protein BY458DRAFT_519489 [Sporodiniella umbellata]|nr:hypothetical protein BY458DRAFT_519489 [Sporodiniella umbellata]